MLYIFLGQDSFAKEAQLKKLKEEFLNRDLEQFNLDIVYAKETTLNELQEKILFLPAKNPRRVLVVKDAQSLRDEIKEFIISYAQKPHKQMVLVLDFDRLEKRDGFFNCIYKYAKIYRFKEAVLLDTFALNRQVNLKKTDYALRVLDQLLKNGERPERILGGLRYAWEKDSAAPLEAKRRLKLLLNCDIDIKTGRLKPAFALEKLIVRLCGLT